MSKIDVNCAQCSSLKTVENGEKNFYAVLTFEAWETFIMPIYFSQIEKKSKTV